MPSYFPDPIEYIVAKRKEGKDNFGSDLFAEGLRVNFRRKPFNPLAAYQQRQEEEGAALLTAGDADFVINKYLADAQVPSAYSETLKRDAQQAAADALEKYADTADPATKERWRRIAATGTDEGGPNWFTNLINVLDTPGELVRMGLADLFSDTTSGVEIMGQDYLDSLLGREANIRERLGEDFVGGEDQFLFESADTLKKAGWGADETNYARGGVGFLLDVVSDPLTWISFGTIGLGKKAAMEAAQTGIAKAGREAVEAIGSKSVGQLTDSASREAAQRITRRIDDVVRSSGARDPKDVAAVTRQATERILAEEQAAIELTGVVSKLATRKLRRDPEAAGYVIDEVLGEVGMIPRGTAIQAMVDDVVAPLADKQFRTIAQQHSWYTGSTHVPNFAKGGVQIGAPFGRRRLPILDKASLRIPGTETNRLASAILGRKPLAALSSKLPPEMRAWMTRMGERLGSERSTYKLAREGNLWDAQASQANARTLVKTVLTEEAIAPLRHGYVRLRDEMLDAGLDAAEVGRVMEDTLAGTANSSVPLNHAIWETARDVVENDVVGIRRVFETFHDMALRVGMDLGKVDNYVPMVVEGKFSKALDALQDSGIDLSLENIERMARSDDSRHGMAIMARMVYNTGETALGTSGSDKGYSQFAKRNKATVIGRNSLIGHDVATHLSGAYRIDRLTPTEANRMVAAALDDLVAAGELDRGFLKSLEDGAFKTDFEEIFHDYVTSMSEAIQYRALIRELKRVGLAQPADSVIDVTDTLASVVGRLNEPMEDWLNDFAAKRGVGHQASKLVDRRVGGRTIRMPAAVVHHRKYLEAEKVLGRAFSRIDRRGREMTNAVGRKVRELVAFGFDEETAERVALTEADSAIADAIKMIHEATLEQVQTMQQAALEMGARNVADPSDLLDAVTVEGRKMMRGAQRAVAELETQVRKSLKLPDPGRINKAVDLFDPDTAPQGYASTMQAMADWFIDSTRHRLGSIQEFAENTSGKLTMEAATESDIAREAVFDLSDRLVVTDATIGELAEMAGAREAARMMYEANFRISTAGYNGVGSLTDEISRAVEAVEAAEFALLEITQMGLDAPKGSTSAARAALREAEAVLDEAAQPLVNSDELLGAIVEHVAMTVDNATDNILTSPLWRDAWTLAVSKQGLGTRGEFAENIADSLTEGFPKLTQKELTQRNAKGAARDVADMTRQLWVEATVARTKWIAGQADLGPSRIKRALQAMRANDQRALPGYINEVRNIIGSITDAAGRPIFDPARIAIREGRIVMEPEELAYVTLTNVMDDIRRVVNNDDITDMEQLAIAYRTWQENPAVIADVSEDLNTFFRQMDAHGTLPQAVEDIEYLNDFIRGLEGIVADLPTPPGRVAAEAPAHAEQMKELLDISEKALQGKMGTRKLNKLWQENKDFLQSELPAEEFDRLANVVARSSALRELKPSKFPEEWRQLVGEMSETEELFTMAVAGFRRDAWDNGTKWANSVADDIEHFYASMRHLLDFADDTNRGLREGYEGLAPWGGEFNQAFDEAREAATKLRKNIGKGGKDRRLADFMPAIPTDEKSLKSWLKDLDKMMSNWEPTATGVPTKGMIPAEIGGLIGEAVDGLVMTPGTALMLENMAVSAATLPSPFGIRMAADAMREVEKWWKGAATVVRPTFVPRNVLGGVVNGLIIGVGPRHYAFVRDNAWRFRHAIEVQGLTPEAALKLLPDNAQPYFEALWESGLLNKGFGHTIEAIRKDPSLGTKVNLLSYKSKPFTWGGRIMETSEDFMRAAAFVRWYDPSNPSSQRLAMEMALTAHFDYSSLTITETKIRRFIPFFVWTRRNIPLQMRALMEQPGHALRLLHFKENLGAEFDKDNFVDEVGFNISPWLSSFAVKTPMIFDADTPFWQRLILDPDLPLTDLEEILSAFDGGYKSAAEYALRMVSPAYSAPLDSLFADYETTAPTGMREIMMLADWFGADPDKSGDDYLVPGAAASLFNTATPFLGEWTRTLGLPPTSGSQAARAGFILEDGLQAEEMAQASLLTLGRALGLHLQTPGDTSSAAWDSIFGIKDAEDRLRLTGEVFDSEEEMNEYIRNILAREGITFNVPDVPEDEDLTFGGDGDSFPKFESSTNEYLQKVLANLDLNN